MRKCARVYRGMRWYVRVCMSVGGSGWVCTGVHGCGMNFQNFFWRIESLHQRNLIHILYEFFFCIARSNGLEKVDK